MHEAYLIYICFSASVCVYSMCGLKESQQMKPYAVFHTLKAVVFLFPLLPIYNTPLHVSLIFNIHTTHASTVATETHSD